MADLFIPETIVTEEAKENKTRLISSVEVLRADTPLFPNYIDGQQKAVGHYGNIITTNNFGTLELANFQGSYEQLMKALGVFSVSGHTLSYMNPKHGNLEETTKRYLFRDDTGEMLNDRAISSRYQILQYEECLWLYFALIDEIRARGYDVTPDVARIYDNGNKLFIQYRIHGYTILGEPVDTAIAMITSHDLTFPCKFVLSAIRLFCSNQMNLMLKSCTQSFSVRHTKLAKNILQEKTNAIMEARERNHKALEEYYTQLSKIKINDKMIYDTYLAMNDINPNEELSLRTANNVENRIKQLFACYDRPDVENHKGTAYGAVCAAADYFDHIPSLRQTATATDNRIKEVLCDGNPSLKLFADTLIKVAG